MLRHGLEHPHERFEFARVCLLRHYARNREFMDELRQCAGRHQEVLDIVAIQTASLQMTHIADYRLSWGLLSFLARQPTALKPSIDLYRDDLKALCLHWGLAANWCAPSLHAALLARKIFPGNFTGSDKEESLAPFFKWDVDRQGEPPYDTVLSLPRLLLRTDAPGRQVDTRLVSRGKKSVYYDPRTDRWDDTLATARRLLGKRRLSPTLKQGLVERRLQIESAFLQDRHTVRKKPRRLHDEHALQRWTYWTHLAICPPCLSTGKILELIDSTQHDGNPEPRTPPRVVDRGIGEILRILGLPPRHARPT